MVTIILQLMLLYEKHVKLLILDGIRNMEIMLLMVEF